MIFKKSCADLCSGVKPYECDTCDKSLVSSSHLTKHSPIHFFLADFHKKTTFLKNLPSPKKKLPPLTL